MTVADLEERFADALHGTARAWRQAVDRRLKSLGMSQASWMTIAVAAKSPRPMSQSELADRLGVEGATLVAMVDRLVKAGLVTRQSSPTDRRVKHILVTEAGTRLYEIVRREAVAVRRELLGELDAKRLQVATELLESLRGRLDAPP
ncbi:MAG TPA: MarR family transcriptional regulator [Steroidobacteraceae bacterium]|nr:MarR family transcriptional regulator [Steroidobacteraceae bacterium]